MLPWRGTWGWTVGDRLEDIRRRWAEHVRWDVGEDGEVWTSDRRVGDVDAHIEVAIANAPEDVAWLLAEVERLRADRDAACEDRDSAEATIARLQEQLALAAPTTDAQGRGDGIVRLLARVCAERDRLRAVLAEPSAEEMAHLTTLVCTLWQPSSTDIVRAILAELRRRAGVADV